MVRQGRLLGTHPVDQLKRNRILCKGRHPYRKKNQFLLRFIPLLLRFIPRVSPVPRNHRKSWLLEQQGCLISVSSRSCLSQRVRLMGPPWMLSSANRMHQHLVCLPLPLISICHNHQKKLHPRKRRVNGINQKVTRGAVIRQPTEMSER